MADIIIKTFERNGNRYAFADDICQALNERNVTVILSQGRFERIDGRLAVILDDIEGTHED